MSPQNPCNDECVLPIDAVQLPCRFSFHQRLGGKKRGGCSLEQEGAQMRKPKCCTFSSLAIVHYYLHGPTGCARPQKEKELPSQKLTWVFQLQYREVTMWLSALNGNCTAFLQGISQKSASAIKAAPAAPAINPNKSSPNPCLAGRLRRLNILPTLGL